MRDQGAARIYDTGGGRIGVCEAFADRVVEPRGGMITLVTDDVDGWHARLKAAGARLRGAPEVLSKFRVYSFRVEDPEGYVIEFQEFLDGDDKN